MIKRELEFSKSRQHNDAIDSHSTGLDTSMKFPFLEICEADEGATGTGIISYQLKNFSLELQSIWLPILTLADENNGINHEGIEIPLVYLAFIFFAFCNSSLKFNIWTLCVAAMEILIVEDAHVITAANAGHSICLLKRCNDIAGRISKITYMPSKVINVFLTSIFKMF